MQKRCGDGDQTQFVDDLVQNQANLRRDMNWEQKVLIGDEVAVRINQLLACRSEQLLQADSSQGPQIIFPEGPSDEGNKSVKKTLKGPRQAKIIKFSSKTRTKPQAQSPGETRPNKRRQWRESAPMWGIHGWWGTGLGTSSPSSAARVGCM